MFSLCVHSPMSRSRRALRLVGGDPQSWLAGELPQPADVLLEHHGGEGLQRHHQRGELPHREGIRRVGDF